MWAPWLKPHGSSRRRRPHLLIQQRPWAPKLPCSGNQIMDHLPIARQNHEHSGLKDQIVRLIAIIWCAIGLVTAPQYVRAQSATPSAPATWSPWFDNHAEVARVRLTSSATAYRQGDQILLSLTLKNTSTDVTLRFWHVTPYLDFDLEVRDAQNNIVQPSSFRSGFAVTPHGAVAIGPGAAFSETDQNGNSSSPLLPLARWGYDLTRPGTYTIKAALNKAFESKNPIMSNAIGITILP